MIDGAGLAMFSAVFNGILFTAGLIVEHVIAGIACILTYTGTAFSTGIIHSACVGVNAAVFRGIQFTGVIE